MNTTSPLPTHFDFKSSEPRIFALWEDHKVFKAEVDPNKKPFCVVIPPPNVTGILHMGHVLDNVPQDIMTRWHRMRGFAAVWIPGTDHAGIATQSVVKKNLLKEGIDIRELGREGFLKRVWEWKEKHGDIIISQLKRLGCSCDWSRERFTMDEGCSEAVLTCFLQYFERGLIYKGKRMINWCTVCGTALANDEVEHQNVSGTLSYFRYPLINSDGTAHSNYVVIATTRPETMLGDTAVAVNPKDERYKELVGKHLLLPLQNRKIPIIADSFVDPSFGTGAVKVTPAHDPNDYQMGLNHKLAMEVVIGEDGRMTASAGAKYAGMKRQEARKTVLADLEALGLVEKVEPHTHAVGHCYRCNSVIEPFISDQWFVRMRPLAEKAKQAVVDGRIKVIPDSEKHDYFHWMDTVEDWCISRQIWWGHRIPVYYCGDCKHMVAKAVAPTQCEKCKSTKITQDEDVLDTWFSSQLWPFSTLGWPNKTKELDYWFPNTWLMSGRDILFFWDARMIMVALELMQEVPFKTLALHGLVRDEQGRKLSKSLGNSPDPLALFDKHGADAIRAAIILHYPMGRQDTRLGEQMFRAGEGLITKLWNASRLVLMQLEGRPFQFNSNNLSTSSLEDLWVLTRLSQAIEEHDKFLAESSFSHALNSVYTFFWSDFCDWYLEIIKPRFRAEGKAKEVAIGVALTVQHTLLKLFHPYIPFLTEELWQILNSQGIKNIAEDSSQGTIALSTWPNSKDFPRDKSAQEAMHILQSVVRGVRDVRHHLNIPPKSELEVSLLFFESTNQVTFKKVEFLALNLAFVSKILVTKERSTPCGYVPFKFNAGLGFVKLPESVKVLEIMKSLDNKITKLEKTLKGQEDKLNIPTFIQNAPSQVVEETKAQVSQMRETIMTLSEFKKSLG